MFRTALFTVLISGALFAQTAQRAPFVRASGDATVSVKPDQAQLSLGVITTADTAGAATSKNAEISAAVEAAVRAVVGSAGDIRTTSFNVNPVYRQNSNPPVIIGYSVSNTLQVTTVNTALVGRVIDAGVGAGANNIGSVRFSLKDSSAAKAQALRLATTQARAQADAIAQGLGGRVGRILAATDASSASVTPIAVNALAGAAATTIDVGNVDVRATVTLEAEFLN